ncbi:hypothetical protein RJ641_005524 [Dillenia turbinata]|uniref:Uncharacterized protein n=1 Tax=Dillenia turbinata TaxID=194707 RepID=A0AAN8V9H8_9MAGN
MVKLNSDGSVDPLSKQASIGGVIRREDGNWIRGYMMNIGRVDAMTEELPSLGEERDVGDGDCKPWQSTASEWGVVREEGKLSSSSEADENLENLAAEGASIALGATPNFEKSWVPYKAAAAEWYFPSAANNNLVKSFSDDDSDTDSEEYTEERMVNNKEVSRMNAIMRPPAPLPTKSIPQLTQIKVLIPEMQEPPWLVVGYMPEISLLKRTFGSREHGFRQVFNPNTTKLQDLRHQIAMRENELKLKDDSRINQNKDAGKKPKATLANDLQSDLGKPRRNAFSKVCESNSTRLIPMESIREILIFRDRKLWSWMSWKSSSHGQTSSSIIVGRNQDAREAACFHGRSIRSVASNNRRLINGSEKANITLYSNMDIRSIELHEKELEDAQEHRRRCEIEERNALKAYHKAQRALIGGKCKMRIPPLPSEGKNFCKISGFFNGKFRYIVVCKKA